MIVDNSYFINEIFIPHAKPSITDNVLDIDAELVSFIEVYSSDCLVKCLGYSLFKEFENNLDSTAANGLKSGAEEKWNELLNGKEYLDKYNKKVYWPGIREKVGAEYKMSFIADYVYYMFEESNDSSRAGVGNVKEQSENAQIVSKTPKVIFAWRRFFEKVVGKEILPVTYCGGAYSYESGIGVDWYGISQHKKSLYQFIMDSNANDPDTYKDFSPYPFKNKNQFGF